MRHLRLFLVALAATIAALPAWAGATLERVLRTGTLTLATEQDYPPQSFVNERSELIGFNIDVARAIAGRLGVTLKPMAVEWETILAGGWDEQWDIAVNSITPTRGRSRTLEFPAVYYYAPASFAVHVASPIRTLPDIDGKIVGTCANCVYEDYLRGDLSLDALGAPPIARAVDPLGVRLYPSDAMAFDDLRVDDSGPIRAVLTTLPTIQVAIRTGYPLRVIEPPVFHEPAAIAIDRGDEEFAAQLAVIVAGLHADGTLSALSMKWYGADLSRPPAR